MSITEQTEQPQQEKRTMNNTTRWLLGIIGALLLGAVLVGGGVLIGARLAGRGVAGNLAYGPAMMAAFGGTARSAYGTGMMQFVDDGDTDDDGDDDFHPMRPGMMGHGYGSGMMGGGYGPGHMWDGDDGPGGPHGFHMMGGAYEDTMHAAIAEVLGLSVEDLEQAMWEEGKTPWQLAEEQGISQDEFLAAMQEAHADVLDGMIADGVITQEQADWMQEHMAEGPYGSGHCPGGQPAPEASTGA